MLFVAGLAAEAVEFLDGIHGGHFFDVEAAEFAEDRVVLFAEEGDLVASFSGRDAGAAVGVFVVGF